MTRSVIEGIPKQSLGTRDIWFIANMTRSVIEGIPKQSLGTRDERYANKAYLFQN
ncbi:MAG: hypothetical protein KAI83_11015 [Thiomargarita sp.]|nr:hypothetical protein [Thiomargarita sp.]